MAGGSPFVFSVTVYDTDGSTALASRTVYIRNDRTNELLSGNTNASGQVVLNLYNFASGWTRGDVITYYVNYNLFEASGSYTTPAVGGGTSVTLTLATASTSTQLKYFTPQEFLDYFNLVSTDDDSENGIKLQQLTLIGTTVEADIDSETSTVFDDNDGSYYSVTDELHDSNFSKQQDWWLDNAPINAVTKVEIDTAQEGSTPVWDDIMNLDVDLMEATTSWAAGTDGAITLNNTPDEVKEGTGCLNIAKTGGTTASVTYSKTFTTAYDFEFKEVSVQYYIEDTDDLGASGTSVQIRFGSDSSNYFAKPYTTADITAASWQKLGFVRTDDDVTVTGNPVVASCDYFAIVVTFAASSTTVAAPDQRLDKLVLGTVNVEVTKDIGRVRITDSSDYPEVGANKTRFTYTYGRSSVPSDIKGLAINETAVRMFGASIARAKISAQSGVDIADTQTFFEDYRRRIINKYRRSLSRNTL